MLVERDGTLFGHDDLAGGSHFPDPCAELLCVRHRGRQGDDRDVCGQVNDHFLPDWAAHLIRQVVDLVEDDDAQVAQRCARVDHVAQDLCRHNDDWGTGVHRRVSGREADVVRAVQVAQFQVLLVGQSLDRRRVERAHSLLEGDVSAKLADDRLSCTCGCSNEDGAASLDGIECLDLERVRGEAQRGHPTGAQRRGGLRLGLVRCVALGCTAHAEADFLLALGDVVSIPGAVSTSFGAHDASSRVQIDKTERARRAASSRMSGVAARRCGAMSMRRLRPHCSFQTGRVMRAPPPSSSAIM